MFPLVAPSSPSLIQPTLVVRLISLLFSYAHLSSLLSVSLVVKALGLVRIIQRRALAHHGSLLAATSLRRDQEEVITKVIILLPMPVLILNCFVVEARMAGCPKSH